MSTDVERAQNVSSKTSTKHPYRQATSTSPFDIKKHSEPGDKIFPTQASSELHLQTSDPILNVDDNIEDLLNADNGVMVSQPQLEAKRSQYRQRVVSDFASKEDCGKNKKFKGISEN